MFNTKSRLEQAIALLMQVENDTWLEHWSADQELDLAEALNRLTFLLKSLEEETETVYNYDLQIADLLIEAAKQ